jgi:hypothetical protein
VFFRAPPRAQKKSKVFHAPPGHKIRFVSTGSKDQIEVDPNKMPRGGVNGHIYSAPVRILYACFGTKISVDRVPKFRYSSAVRNNGAQNTGFTWQGLSPDVCNRGEVADSFSKCVRSDGKFKIEVYFG